MSAFASKIGRNNMLQRPLAAILLMAAIPMLLTGCKSDEQKAREAYAKQQKAEEEAGQHVADLQKKAADTEAELAKLKADYDSAHREVTDLQRQLDATTDEAKKKDLQAELDAAKEREKKAVSALGGGGSSTSKKPCKCAPGDPLCSCP